MRWKRKKGCDLLLSVSEKFKEVLISVLPIFVIIILFSLTLTPLETHVIIQFIIGTLLMIIGMPVFLLGIDISISPIGEQISGVLTKTNKLWIILLGGGFFGFVVSIAEPDLHILANQVRSVTQGNFNSALMILLVSLGIGLMVLFGMLRIIKNILLKRFMTLVYLIILVLGVFSQPDFLAIAFDASGSTTGAVSVPFILALSAGISNMTKSNEKEENDGFGMLGIASTGAIIAVLAQGILSGTGPIEGSLPIAEIATDNVFIAILQSIPQVAKETFAALAPILIIYFIMNKLWIKLKRQKLKRVIIGSIYTYFGLVLFLTGVNTGFIEASSQVGYQIAAFDKPWLLMLVGIIFGVITVPAEPSVHVLTRQIEDETSGSIKAKTVMYTLCIGVGVAVGLSVLRILIPELQLWHILLPGMAISIVLSYFIPDIFVGIAFDSGGVAAGTMTAAFILPYAQGAAEYMPSANVVLDAFGVIALVAMTPLISVQLLGVIYRMKTRPLLAEDIIIDGDKEEI